MDEQIKTWEQILDEGIKAYQDDFEKRLELHTMPLVRIDEELTNVNTVLTDIHNSNQDLTKQFLELNERAKENKNLVLAKLCYEYCIEKGISMEVGIPFFLGLLKHYKIRMWLANKSFDLKTKMELQQIEIKESLKGEFTTARRLLAIEFLLKAANYGEAGTNKIKIAEFIDFLTSKESIPKDMRDSHLYTIVKNNWDNAGKNSLENLVYVRERFANIGLKDIVGEIDKIIENKKSKEI